MSRGELMFCALMMHMNAYDVPRETQVLEYTQHDTNNNAFIETFCRPSYKPPHYEFIVFNAMQGMTRLLHTMHTQTFAGFLEKWITRVRAVHEKHPGEMNPEIFYQARISFADISGKDPPREVHGLYSTYQNVRGGYHSDSHWSFPGGAVHIYASEKTMILRIVPRTGNSVLTLSKMSDEVYATIDCLQTRRLYSPLPEQMKRIAEKFGFPLSPTGKQAKKSSER